MNLNIEEYLSYGQVIKFTGINSILINNPSKLWILYKGSLDVYVTEIRDNVSYGSKFHIFNMVENDFLFGSFTYFNNMERYSFLVSGNEGTEVFCIDKEKFLDLIDSNTREIFILSLLKFWEERISANNLNKFNLFKNINELVDLLNRTKLINDTSIFNNQITAFFVQQFKLKHETDNIRIKKKTSKDYQNMRSALSKLASSLGYIDEEKIQTEDIQTGVIVNSLATIAKNLKIEIVKPELSNIKEEHKIIEEVCRNSGMKFRRVFLDDKWWEKDNGPLLVRIKEINEIVSLIPESPKKYRLYNFSKNENYIVTSEVAEKLSFEGYVFYSTFSNKTLGLRDFLSFVFKNCCQSDLLGLLFMSMLIGVLGLVFPIASAAIFDNVILQGENQQLWQISVMLIASIICIGLFQVVRYFSLIRFENKSEVSVQSAVWERLLSLPVSFFRDYSAGEIAMRAMGISNIKKVFSGVTINSVISGIFSLINLVAMFYFSTKLAKSVLSLIVVIYILIIVFQSLYVIYQRKIIAKGNKLSGFLLQIMGGVLKIKVSGSETGIFYIWAKKYVEQRKLKIKARKILNIVDTFNFIYPILISMVIFYVFSYSANDELSIGNFIGFNAALTSFIIYITQFFKATSSIVTIIPLYQNISPILKARPEYDINKIKPGILKGGIEVSHLTFRYKKNTPYVLKDVSFYINPGEYVALVGASGCGKSTLLRLLISFEKPETGEIFYDGRNLEKVDLYEIRRQLGVVLQSSQLSTGSILSNIIGSNYKLSIDDAWEAARLAGIDKDINKMPMGMNTLVNDGATIFSGGQKQRILIARALINKPKILYFDEATSSLDNKTQAIINNTLKDLNCTRFVIAHRLSTVQYCDRIYVMDKGQIVESGTYEQLIKNGGAFFEMAQRQIV